MAFDTLQRWHEGHHVDVSGFQIHPVTRTPIPRYSPWPAVSQALDKILPTLDPLTIAKRRLEMQQIPLEQQKLTAQSQVLPFQTAALRAQYERAAKAANAPMPPNWGVGPDGKYYKKTPAEQRLEANQLDFNATGAAMDHGIQLFSTPPPQSSGQQPTSILNKKPISLFPTTADSDQSSDNTQLPPTTIPSVASDNAQYDDNGNLIDTQST